MRARRLGNCRIRIVDEKRAPLASRSPARCAEESRQVREATGRPIVYLRASAPEESKLRASRYTFRISDTCRFAGFLGRNPRGVTISSDEEPGEVRWRAFVYWVFWIGRWAVRGAFGKSGSMFETSRESSATESVVEN